MARGAGWGLGFGPLTNMNAGRDRPVQLGRPDLSESHTGSQLFLFGEARSQEFLPKVSAIL